MTCEEYLRANADPATLFGLSRGERAAALAHMLTCPACQVLTHVRPPAKVSRTDFLKHEAIALADEQDPEFVEVVRKALANEVRVVGIFKAR